MDAKRFMQLVEEKQKRVLAKKEAPLKWEQKLEAAATKRKADAKAKERKLKVSKHKRRSVSVSGSDSDNSEERKKAKKPHQKQKKHDYYDLADYAKKMDKKAKRKLKRRSSGSDGDTSDEYDSDSEDVRNKRLVPKKHRYDRRITHLHGSDDSSSDGYDSDAEEDKRKRRGHKKHRPDSDSDSGAPHSCSDEDDDPVRRQKLKNYHKHHRTHSNPSYPSSDEIKIRRGSHPKHDKHHSRTRYAERLADDNKEAGRIEQNGSGYYYQHESHQHHSNGQVHPCEPPHHNDKTLHLSKCNSPTNCYLEKESAEKPF